MIIFNARLTGKKLITTILLIGFSLVAVAALPPDMQADRYLVQVEKALKSKDSDKDHKAADIMEKIMALKDQHNLELPIEFYFKFAKLKLNSRSYNKGRRALNAIEHYLAVAGKTGTNYIEALGLYDTALSFKLVLATSAAEVEQLIKLGADVNARQANGDTPFMHAVSFGKYPETIKALIQAGAAVNAKYENGYTPLHKATYYNNNPNIIKALVQAGADVNAKNEYKNTPLMLLNKYNEEMSDEDKAKARNWLKNPSLLR